MTFSFWLIVVSKGFVLIVSNFNLATYFIFLVGQYPNISVDFII